MRRPVIILETLAGLVIRTTLVVALFLLFAGHNAPGGGFIGGLVAGATLVLRWVERDAEAVDRIVPGDSRLVLGVGLTVSALAGFGGWWWGTAFLDAVKLEADLPLLGHVKATTALPFDIGVFLVVIGLVAGVVESLGREAEIAEEAEA